MESQPNINEILSSALEKLVKEKMLPENIQFLDDTQLLGPCSLIDSIGFVTLITSIEDSLSDSCDRPIYLLVDEIPGVNVDMPILTLAMMREHLASLVNVQS